MDILSSTYIDEFIAVIILQLVALASPGPDFAIVVQHSLLHNRKVGMMTALGIAVGFLFHVMIALLGVGLIISKNALLFMGVKVLACAYLLYLAYNSFKCSADVLDEKIPQAKNHVSPLKAFQMGVMTNVLNPKAILFFLTLFTVVVSPTTPLSILLSYGTIIFIMGILWFLMIALCFSNERVRNLFRDFSHWIHRITGVIFILLAFKLAFEIMW